MPYITVLPHEQKIQINNIFTIGGNYAKDSAERTMNLACGPVVSLKPTSAVILEGAAIHLPSFAEIVHYEIELVLLIGKQGKSIPEQEALQYVLGYGVGLDLTAHDLHLQAKAEGLPWTVCKGFDTAAPLSAFINIGRVPEPQRITFTLDVNGERRQNGEVRKMVFGIPRIVSHLSSMFTLHPGDLIFTGTPQGVGPLHSGDVLRLDCMGLIGATFRVA